MARVKNGLYEFCVSTIVERRKLEDFALKGSGKFTEARKWTTGKKLFDTANYVQQKMPVILSDAAYNCEHLQLWGIIRELILGEGGTTIHLTDIQRVRGYHRRTELIRRKNDQRIAEHFIRPYAICRTPSFLK
jgi:hypothetical protein